MIQSRLSLFTCLLACCAALMISGCSKKDGSAASNEQRFFNVGTGSQTGVYYPTGQSIAKLVNDKQAEYGVNLSVESTGGSVFNTNSLLSGDMDFGIVQSDIQYQAVKGEGSWKDKGPQEKLRAVFSIHPELVTLVTTEESGIKTLADLKGKRVNLDSPGSGTRPNAIAILKAVGIDYEKDIQAESLSAKEAPSLLQDDRIDAFFFTVAHPSGVLKEAAAGGRQIRFVPIDDPALDGLIKSSPYLARSHIPIQFYEQAANKEDVSTIGVKATLLTTSDTPDEVAYAITKEVFTNLESFKKLHEAYSVLTPESMLDALSAPIHPGAKKYFDEAGLSQP